MLKFKAKFKKSYWRFKKAQEEMVGFALIIIIVAVIALIVLAILNKKPAAPEESRELSNFLESMAQYTTDCSSSPNSYYSMKELIRACSMGEKCFNGKLVCDILNKNLDSMLKESFPTGEQVKSYYLTIEHNATTTKEILVIGNATCAGNKKGADYFYPANPGVITIYLQGCY